MSQEPSRPSDWPHAADPPAGSSADGAPAASSPAGPRRSTSEVLAAAVGASGVGVAVLVAGGWLALLSGVAVLFGLGLVVALALAVLGVVLLVRRPGARGWLVVPMIAVAVAAVAVSATGMRVDRQRGTEVHAPRTVQELPPGGYRTGLGAQLVDLRHLDLPAGRVVDLAARSDLDRTVVALPHDRCWNLEVRWRTGRLRLPGVEENAEVQGLQDDRDVASWARRTRDDYVGPSFGRIALFGRVSGGSQGTWTSYVSHPSAPTLRLDLRSEGSSFVVRDYPDEIPPLATPEWPLGVQPPATPGELREAWASPRRSRSSARAWKRYRPRRTAFVEEATALMDGGCGRQEVRR